MIDRRRKGRGGEKDGDAIQNLEKSLIKRKEASFLPVWI